MLMRLSVHLHAQVVSLHALVMLPKTRHVKYGAQNTYVIRSYAPSIHQHHYTDDTEPRLRGLGPTAVCARVRAAAAPP